MWVLELRRDNELFEDAVRIAGVVDVPSLIATRLCLLQILICLPDVALEGRSSSLTSLCVFSTLGVRSGTHVLEGSLMVEHRERSNLTSASVFF